MYALLAKTYSYFEYISKHASDYSILHVVRNVTHNNVVPSSFLIGDGITKKIRT